MAHAEIRLVLLRSGSDTVHDTTLHRTLLSTFLAWCDQPYVWPRSAFDTAMAGCSLQGTANSPSSTAKALYHLTENFATKIHRLLIWVYLCAKITLIFMRVGARGVYETHKDPHHPRLFINRTLFTDGSTAHFVCMRTRACWSSHGAPQHSNRRDNRLHFQRFVCKYVAQLSSLDRAQHQV